MDGQEECLAKVHHDGGAQQIGGVESGRREDIFGFEWEKEWSGSDESVDTTFTKI